MAGGVGLPRLCTPSPTVRTGSVGLQLAAGRLPAQLTQLRGEALASRPGPCTAQGLSTLQTCQPTVGSLPLGSLWIASSPKCPPPLPPPPRSAPGQGLPPPTRQHLSAQGPRPALRLGSSPRGALLDPHNAGSIPPSPPHPMLPARPVVTPLSYSAPQPAPRVCLQEDHGAPSVAPTVGLVLASPSPLDCCSPQGLGEPAPGLGLEALPHRSWGSWWSQLQGPASLQPWCCSPL